MSNDKQTIIEDGTEFDGSITSRCPITVSGEMKGELLAPALTITSSGAVHGQVKVEELRSEGEVSGEIDAELVELAGKVSDSTVITATSLEVKLNQPDGGLQVTFGNCELNVGEPRSAGSSSKKTETTTVVEPEYAGEPVL